MAEQITAVAVRDQATHDGLFVEMAYRGVIGSEAPSHVDVVAAARGARLPCRNGWTFTKVFFLLPQPLWMELI